MSQCERKCWQAFPALFLVKVCFTFSVRTGDYVRFSDVKLLPGRLSIQCRCEHMQYVAALAWCNFAAVWSILFSFAHFCSSCRQKDSKDEVAKAEKELEEIHKVIEESGGKLSNRLLQCDVRLLFFFIDARSPNAFSRWQMKWLVDYWFSVQLEFARRRSDGSTTLAIVNPADPAVGGNLNHQRTLELLWPLSMNISRSHRV